MTKTQKRACFFWPRFTAVEHIFFREATRNNAKDFRSSPQRDASQRASSLRGALRRFVTRNNRARSLAEGAARFRGGCERVRLAKRVETASDVASLRCVSLRRSGGRIKGASRAADSNSRTKLEFCVYNQFSLSSRFASRLSRSSSSSCSRFSSSRSTIFIQPRSAIRCAPAIVAVNRLRFLPNLSCSPTIC